MILVVDANHLVHTYWHINPDPPDVVERFLTKLNRIRAWARWHNPGAKCTAVFDNGDKSFRHSLEPTYKAGRTKNESISETVDASREAMSNSQDWLAFKSPSGYEADDVIASMASQYEGKCVILSADRDFYQCLRPGRVILARKSFIDAHGVLSFNWYNTKSFAADYDFGPKQWVDFQCLVGDPSDNIKGAKGIGKVTAKALINEYGSVENIDPETKIMNRVQRESWSDFCKVSPVLRAILTLQENIDCSEALQ